MLKIIDSVDLKELEKFGFKKYAKILFYYPKGNGGNCRYFSSIKIEEETREICFNLENMSWWCNSLEELESDFENIKYSYECFKNIIDDLKKANLIEEI